MDAFAKNIRARAEQLGMSNAEVAERLGLDPRRYGHYVTGRSEPDLATVVKIANVLKSSPNLLLGFELDSVNSRVSQLVATCKFLNDTQLDMLIDLAETTAKKSQP
ncbi:helix-turn-helix domain-containing protein [Asticcacaulis excentricus]|uniref:helix-turn-helix domain-containing protein n=1 Tax=Asticcacaulis excentricus TaxID=78587 RepID=UPI000F82FA06|nr:helix-turn-helix transcriptional regulator [Asticcacaulis excentricus]